MARYAKTKSVRERTDLATAAATAAASKMLRSVNQFTRADRANKIHDLVDLCGCAADHLSQANKLLYSGPTDTEEAIVELDAALECLKKVTNERGNKADPNQQTGVKSA